MAAMNVLTRIPPLTRDGRGYHYARSARFRQLCFDGFFTEDILCHLWVDSHAFSSQDLSLSEETLVRLE